MSSNFSFVILFSSLKFKVCKSVHHHTIQINHQLDATISPVYYPDVYLQLNMFRASSHPSSGAQHLQQQPLILPSGRGGSSAVGRGRAGRRNCCIQLVIYLNCSAFSILQLIFRKFRKRIQGHLLFVTRIFLIILALHADWG